MKYINRPRISSVKLKEKQKEINERYVDRSSLSYKLLYYAICFTPQIYFILYGLFHTTNFR